MPIHYMPADYRSGHRYYHGYPESLLFSESAVYNRQGIPVLLQSEDKISAVPELPM